MQLLKKALSIIIIFIFFSTSNAQNYLGVHSSNYSGVMGTDLNPASFVDGRFIVDVNLGSFNFIGFTNAGYFNTNVLDGKWWINSLRPDANGIDNPDNNWQSLPTNQILDRNYSESSSKTLDFYNNMQLDLLNFMFHINPKIAVGFTGKLRSITNVDDINPELAILAENDFDTPSLWNQNMDQDNLSANHLSWLELGLIYSQVLKDDGEHFMKMGGKIKWLSGITHAYFDANNLSYNVKNADTLSNLSGDFEYSYSTRLNQLNSNSSIIDMIDFSNFGLGLDLGFIYEWRPEWKKYKYDMDGEKNIWRKDQDKYKIRAGIGLLDLGSINTGSVWVKDGRFAVNSSDFDINTFELSTDFNAADSTVSSLVENDDAWSRDGNTKQTMATPTAISLQFDYHIWKWFYVNASGIISVQNRNKARRVRVANHVSVTPSFDFPWFGIGLPISYNKYAGFKAGIGARLGPLTIGCTDYNALFASGKVNGAQFYAGLRIPVLYSHPSDVDMDLVSDELDQCPLTKGVWKFKGCPDTDNDGIMDAEDLCPNEPGLAKFQGCPDRDNDNIIDSKDDCPDIPGLKEFNGCPDRDNDSIIDSKDDCPDIPGLKKFNGCPDTDNDGIKDEDDACPEVAGEIENNGCPDTDKDGLFDFIDNCPTEPGPKENNGCPWPDSDGDGLLNKDDQCPYLPGPIENKGCPYQDTDEDGILDKDDKCPSVYGPVENQGCPIIEEEVKEILKTAFDNLEFETGKAIIKDESIPSLTELAEVLLKKEGWKLQIAGHTDNVGKPQNNLILSKKRAESVESFMISKLINDERLTVLYFGETQPIDDNSTNEGRQKNRRVEMTIIFE